MLSKSLSCTLDNKLRGLLRQIETVRSDYDRHTIEKLTLTKCNEHKVKLIPCEVWWGVHNEYNIVIDVQIMLHSIILCMTSKNFKNRDSLACIDTLREIYMAFKESLRENGTSNPPYKIGITTYKKSDIMKVAYYIKNNFIKGNQQAL